MLGSFRSEVFRLRKRPSTWVLGLALVAFVLIFGYFFGYQAVLSQRAVEERGGPVPPGGVASVLEPLLPNSILSNVVFSLSGGIGAVVLILGALAVGSEYSWDTLKTIFVRRPERLKVFFGKVLAVWIVLFGFVIALLIAGASGSFAVASIEGSAVDWPPLWDWVRAIVAVWLILVVYSALGVFLATLLRSSSLAIGLGLAYAVVVETLLSSLQAFSEGFQRVQEVLLAELVANFAAFFTAVSGDEVQRNFDMTQNVLTMLLYTAVFVLVAALLIKRRDVT